MDKYTISEYIFPVLSSNFSNERLSTLFSNTYDLLEPSQVGLLQLDSSSRTLQFTISEKTGIVLLKEINAFVDLENNCLFLKYSGKYIHLFVIHHLYSNNHRYC